MNEKPHTVKSYEEQLQKLTNDLVVMGGNCETALGNSIKSLCNNDNTIADTVINNDAVIDNFESQIEQEVVDLIALRQPMAIDLRETVTALKISSDLERIGDLAKNISKRTKLINGKLPDNLSQSIDRVGSMVQKQLKLVLDSYTNRSPEIALDVWEKDEEVDNLTNLCMEEVIKHIKSGSENIDHGSHLLFVTKNIERIVDHVTNIAEQIYFLVKGTYLEGERPKGSDPILNGEK
jgi:phosphate transport system protein